MSALLLCSGSILALLWKAPPWLSPVSQRGDAATGAQAASGGCAGVVVPALHRAAPGRRTGQDQPKCLKNPDCHAAASAPSRWASPGQSSQGSQHLLAVSTQKQQPLSFSVPASPQEKWFVSIFLLLVGSMALRVFMCVGEGVCLPPTRTWF